MIFKWIKDYISDVKTLWIMIRYKRSNDLVLSSHSQMMGDQDRWEQRLEMWQPQIYQAMNEYNTQVGGHGGNGYIAYGGGGGSTSGEWSHGEVGNKIIKRVDAGGKSIGVCTKWDLFYFMVKDKNATSYNNMIYLSTDGFSKHDHRVEILGVDII